MRTMYEKGGSICSLGNILIKKETGRNILIRSECGEKGNRKKKKSDWQLREEKEKKTSENKII